MGDAKFSGGVECISGTDFARPVAGPPLDHQEGQERTPPPERLSSITRPPSDSTPSIHRHTATPRRTWLRRTATLTLSITATATLPACAFKHFTPIPYRPALLEATHPDRPGRILLFGSVHAGLARFYPLPDAVQAAYERADRLAIELDTASRLAELREAVAPFNAYAAGESLETTLSPQLLHALREHLRPDPHEWRRTRFMKPWALALSMVSADDAGLEASGVQGIETFLLSAARRDGKPVVELESAAEQAFAFAGGSPAEQEAALALRLRQIKAFDRTFSDIVDAWRIGDLRWLAALKQRAYPADGALAGLHRRVFGERDSRMAQRLADLAAQPGTTLAALGAFHLVGDDGVPARLRQAGFEVRRLEYGR